MIYFYAAAAFAYDRLGFSASDDAYEAVAEEVCADYTAALRTVMVADELNPAMCKWYC